jgi:tryptophan-rich sensory protein
MPKMPVLFIGHGPPLAGLVCIIPLWLGIAFTIKRFYRISKTAGLLLVPYILWVTFASLLNLSIWTLN